MTRKIISILLVALLIPAMASARDKMGKPKRQVEAWIYSIGFGGVYVATLPTTLGTNGQQLTTDGTGALSWAASGGNTATGAEFEGATANDFETLISITDPTVDNTVNIPAAVGTASFFFSTLTTNAPNIANSVWGASNGIVFEGATANDHEITVSPADPGADKTVTIPADTGAVMLSALATNAVDAANSVTGVSNGILMEGATANAHETTLSPVDATADRTIQLPNASGIVSLNTKPLTDYTEASSPVTLTTALAGQVFTNAGAGGAVIFNLPEASANIGSIYTFAVSATQNLDINPDNLDVILYGGCSAGDALRADAAGENVTLMAIDATNWIVLGGAQGTWSDVN